LPGRSNISISEAERIMMHKTALVLGLGAALIVSGCNKSGDGNRAATGQTPAAAKAAGGQTIAAGLPANSQFMAAAKAAGIDKTLAGPGPYTVFVPDDAAFAKLPPGTLGNATDPKQRAAITGMLTYLILPGTVLAADIGKTIDNAKGKATMLTVGGQTFTASKDGGTIVLADSAGHTAHVTNADRQFSNGVVHQIDAVLTPPGPGAQGQSAASGQPAG
jgi:uncharacterized surface protein with fasciclin (FAS1) repeats